VYFKSQHIPNIPAMANLDVDMNLTLRSTIKSAAKFAPESSPDSNNSNSSPSSSTMQMQIDGPDVEDPIGPPPSRPSLLSLPVKKGKESVQPLRQEYSGAYAHIWTTVCPNSYLRVESGTPTDIPMWNHVFRITKRMSDLKVTVPLYDAWIEYDEDDKKHEKPLFFMLIGKGTPLAQTDTPLPPHLVERLCSLVDLMHEHGVFHNDIKIENVVLYEGDVRLIDFGMSVDFWAMNHYVPKVFRVCDLFQLLIGQTVLLPETVAHGENRVQLGRGVCGPRPQPIGIRDFPRAVRKLFRDTYTSFKSIGLSLNGILMGDNAYLTRFVSLQSSDDEGMIHVPRDVSVLLSVLQHIDPANTYPEFREQVEAWDIFRRQHDTDYIPPTPTCVKEFLF